MIWRAFRQSPRILRDSKACIVDNTGLYYVDNEYVKLGEKEGWLKRIGYHHNERGELVWRYGVTGQ